MSSGLGLGIFLTPASDPARPMAEILDWNIDVIRKAYNPTEFLKSTPCSRDYLPVKAQ